MSRPGAEGTGRDQERRRAGMDEGWQARMGRGQAGMGMGRAGLILGTQTETGRGFRRGWGGETRMEGGQEGRELRVRQGWGGGIGLSTGRQAGVGNRQRWVRGVRQGWGRGGTTRPMPDCAGTVWWGQAGGWGCDPGCEGYRGRLSLAVLSLTLLSSRRGSHLTDVSTGGARGAWAYSWSRDSMEAMGSAGYRGGPGFRPGPVPMS